MWRVEERLRRLHDLGFDVGEMEVLADEDGQRLRIVPRVVESGYHQDRLFALTGLWAGENQARRLLDDIHQFGAELQARTGTPPPENVVAVRWFDQRFEPIIGSIPPSLIGKLQAAEIFHQLLEHRWFESERHGRDVTLEEALETYIPDILEPAPDEHLELGSPTASCSSAISRRAIGVLSVPRPHLALGRRRRSMGPLRWPIRERDRARAGPRDPRFAGQPDRRGRRRAGQRGDGTGRRAERRVDRRARGGRAARRRRPLRRQVGVQRRRQRQRRDRRGAPRPRRARPAHRSTRR